MSLEAPVGTPLNRRPAVPKKAEVRRIKKPRREPQIGDNWCWAASIESARLTIGRGVRRQHLITARHLNCGEDRCCAQPTDSQCDRTINRAELEDLWRREGFSQMSYDQNTIDFDRIQHEIAQNRLVLLEIDNSHVVLVYGWEIDRQGVKIVHIIDTWPGAPRFWNFDDLDGYDQWGSWTGTGLGIVYDGPGGLESC